MKSALRGDLSGLFRQCMLTYPLQHARLGAGQDWSWIDTQAGEQTLVLLPGFMGEAETSFLYILALADHLRVVSVSYPPLIAQVDMLGESLCALLDHLGIAQAALLGGSSSGCLAQAFVRRHPARFERLILTHTGLPSLTRARTARRYLRLLRCLPFGLLRQVLPLSVAAYFPRQTPVHAFWRAHFQAVLCRLTLDGLRNRFALMDDFHSHAHFQAGDLAAWPGKVLLMEMSRDHLTTPAEQAAMRALYPGASLRIFSNAAHYDAVEDPEEQIQAILEAYA